MASTAPSAADKARWLTYLGAAADTFSSSSSPSYFGAIDHVAQMARDMHSGQRPDLAPPGFTPSSAPSPPSLDTEPPSADLSSLSLTARDSDSVSPFVPAPASMLSSVSQETTPALVSLQATLLSVSGAVSSEAFVSARREALARREAELGTKEGRARWERVEAEAGLGAAGGWKRAKDRVAAHRAQGKIEWREFQGAVAECRRREKEGGAGAGKKAEEAAGRTTGKKGKKGKK